MAIPKWRYVRYSDDGCAIYQCLNCYNTWEARTSPGYNDDILEVPCAVKGGWSHNRGDGTEEHYVHRKEPLYLANWIYCPICGVKWEGSTRTDEDEYGPRRARIREAMTKARRARDWENREETWLVLESQVRGKWSPMYRFPMFKYPAATLLKFKRDRALPGLELRFKVVKDWKNGFGYLSCTEPYLR